MLEKTEGAITNGQSRDTGNIGHMTQNSDKQAKITTQKTKKLYFSTELEMNQL
jgi:hypothetical protein